MIATRSSAAPSTRSSVPRSEALELLQHPARRRAVVRRLRRAADLPALPQDGPRADAAAAQRAVAAAGRLRLAVSLEQGRRRARGPLQRAAARARQAAGSPWPHLPQGAEPHPGPVEAQAPDRRPHRPGDVDGHRRRRQGRRLRGAAREERRRHQVRRRPVLHAARADQGDGRCDAARSRDRRSPTRPAAPAASCSPPTTTSPTTTRSTATRRSSCATTPSTASRSSTTPRASAR